MANRKRTHPALKVRRLKKDEIFCPYESNSDIRSLIELFEVRDLPKVHITVPSLPLSLNHQTGKRVMMGVNAYTGKKYAKVHHYLKPQAMEFRELFAEEYKKNGFVTPTNSIAIAFCLFEGPNWVSLKNTVREKDCDNLVKPLLDAFQEASGFQDENFWAHAASKVVAPEEKSHLIVYFTGDIINSYHGKNSKDEK